jgi:7-carboxy-7-deazaguanine synthase
MDSAIQAFHPLRPPSGNGLDETSLLPEALRRLGADEVLVNEMFLSIQGESTWAGWPCFFIRLAGCHLRCGWCDTAYAFHEGTARPVKECIERARASGARLVEVTGGEPLLQKATRALLGGLAEGGLQTLVETSGAVSIEGIDPRVARIVDVKCPGSGMESKNLPGIEGRLRPPDELKLVISSRADYEWARGWIESRKGRLPIGVPLNFSPVFERLGPADLAKWILEDRLPVRMNLQLHKVIWDPGRRGV